MEADNTFKLIKESSEWLAKENDKHYSLKLDKYREEQKSIRTTVKQMESLLKLKGELDVSALPNEVNRWANDKTKQERYDSWIKNLQKDIYLDQATKVMNDMISAQNTAKKGF
jgi:carboxyl-terminal processing protease